MKPLGRVAVIGAGLSGLSCAQALRGHRLSVHVYEATRFIGGRCATRLWQGHLVDIGVQYFTAQSTEFKKELLTSLRQFRPITLPILDVDQSMVKSDIGPRFYVLQGNHYFAHVLAKGLDVRLNTNVDRIEVRDAGLIVQGETYDVVVSALPAPATSLLLALPEAATEFDPSLTAMFEFCNIGIGTSNEAYGRILPDGVQAMAASYCENSKAGRIVGNKTVFVVQATTHFSIAHAETPPEDYLPTLQSELESIWSIPTGRCSASSGHLWKYGRPTPSSRRDIALPKGVFSCGDSHTDSVVESVWADGRRAAQNIVSYLNIA